MDNSDFIVYESRNRDIHPEWSEDQVSVKSAMDIQADNLISENPKEGITDEVVRILVERSKLWIERHLPEIYERVQVAFQYILDNIGTWISKGIEYLSELITEFF